MITRTDKIRQTPFWQRELAQSIQNIDELLHYVKLERADVAVSDEANNQFSLRIPRGYADRIAKADASDPILKQILPIDEEMRNVAGYNTDPVGDLQSIVAPGLLHKYHGRALMITTGACAVHCRYCFRRHFSYHDACHSNADWSAAIDHLNLSPQVNEVILSGGDPLSLSDTRLSRLVDKITSVPHVTTLRIHTRVPVVLPSRICSSMIEWINKSRLRVVMVIHCNHAREIDQATIDAMRTLTSTGVTLLNQAVLLAGVNDSVKSQKELSERLFSAGVLPYYLHMLDPVSGAAHFEVSEQRAKSLYEGLRACLPGYLVPRLVRELEGEPSKTPVFA